MHPVQTPLTKGATTIDWWGYQSASVAGMLPGLQLQPPGAAGLQLQPAGAAGLQLQPPAAASRCCWPPAAACWPAAAASRLSRGCFVNMHNTCSADGTEREMGHWLGRWWCGG
ncbi:hypothetical protein HaLaN_30757 [Haematococcus lacustris]|uniref:Uncharacterized protein n=1 Tax=Haematococcus lacustris TaxID=44745 RepID=A0A6A0AGE7_HAELA|nr:hypothetical protein HaLaN_30757 [Haematococcus lacustris]